MKENEFIKALIELVGRHGCTIEEIKELFHSYSDKIITEPMDNEEFDVMIRFDDGSDPYYIVLKMKDAISFTTDFCRKTMQILDSDKNE